MDKKDVFDGLQVENLFDIVKVEEAFKKCGVDIKNKDGSFKSLIDVFEELSKTWEIANFKYDCKHKFEIWREGMEVYEGDFEYYCLAICKHCGIQRNFDGEDVKNLDSHKDYKWEDVKID